MKFTTLSSFLLIFVGFFAMSQFSHADLVGAWLLDGDASDVSGRGHNGVPDNIDWVDDGRFGGAAEVSADGGHITIETHPDLDLFLHTIMIWVRSSGATDGRRFFLDKSCFGCYDGLPSNYSLMSHEGGYVNFWHRKGMPAPFGDVFVNAPAKLFAVVHDGDWHHLAGRYDGSSMKIFVDGELAAERQVDEAEAGGPNAPGIVDAPVMIGAGSPGGSGTWDPGMAFDEAAIFNDVLEEEEIRSIYEEGLADAGYFSKAVNAGGKLATTWAKLKAE